MLVLAGFLLATTAASAQWDPYPWKRVPRTPDGKVDLNAPAQRTSYGKPDLSGFWMPEDQVKYLLNLAADMKEQDIPLKPSARDLYNKRIDNNGKDHPGVSCLPSGIPEKDNIPDGLKLVQTEDLVLLLHESRTIYRQIFTDGRPLPVDPDPTFNGASVGHWDGNFLLSTAYGFRLDTNMESSGLPKSDKAIAYERIWLADDDTLRDEFTLVDPVALVKPWTVTKTYKRAPPDFEIEPYVCLENNRNPIAPDGSIQAILQTGEKPQK